MQRKVEADFDVLGAKIESDMAGPVGEFVDEYRLANLVNGEIMFCAQVNHFEKMGAFTSNPAKVQWDRDFSQNWRRLRRILEMQ